MKLSSCLSLFILTTLAAFPALAQHLVKIQFNSKKIVSGQEFAIRNISAGFFHKVRRIYAENNKKCDEFM